MCFPLIMICVMMVPLILGETRIVSCDMSNREVDPSCLTGCFSQAIIPVKGSVSFSMFRSVGKHGIQRAPISCFSENRQTSIDALYSITCFEYTYFISAIHMQIPGF